MFAGPGEGVEGRERWQMLQSMRLLSRQLAFIFERGETWGRSPHSLSPSEGSCRRSPSGAAFPAPACSLLELWGSVLQEAGADTQMLCGVWSALQAIECSRFSADSVARTSASRSSQGGVVLCAVQGA